MSRYKKPTAREVMLDALRVLEERITFECQQFEEATGLRVLALTHPADRWHDRKVQPGRVTAEVGAPERTDLPENKA